jgi:3-hydroxy-9,10-secoandrosta-1,3,5(10)-triene-9,17-dione monooxygenase reductase component
VIIIVDLVRGGTPVLAEPDDLSALSVCAHSTRVAWPELRDALHRAGAGSLVGEQAWLATEWVERSARQSGANWSGGSPGILACAKAHNWLTNDGLAVRVHVDWELDSGVPSPGEGNESVSAGLADTIAPEEYRRVLSHFITGVVVVTAMDGTRPVGFTCQSFASVSLEPPLVLICPSKTSKTWPKIVSARAFSINVLAYDQHEVCARFAQTGVNKFVGISWRPGRVTGTPVLDGVLSWMECNLVDIHEAGDHWIVTGRVLNLEASGHQPLTFFRGKLDAFVPSA